MKSRKFNERNL